MYKKTFEKDELIIRYGNYYPLINILNVGDMGSEYYILDKGDVEILVYK